jgi:hypothetical protein
LDVVTGPPLSAILSKAAEFLSGVPAEDKKTKVVVCGWCRAIAGLGLEQLNDVDVFGFMFRR